MCISCWMFVFSFVLFCVFLSLSCCWLKMFMKLFIIFVIFVLFRVSSLLVVRLGLWCVRIGSVMVLLMKCVFWFGYWCMMLWCVLLKIIMVCNCLLVLCSCVLSWRLFLSLVRFWFLVYCCWSWLIVWSGWCMVLRLWFVFFLIGNLL